MATAWSPTSSKGGAVQVASMKLTHAQILALPTATSYVIVPTPGSGQMLVPVWALFVCDTTAGAYTNFNTSATVGSDPAASSVYLVYDAPNAFQDATGPIVAGTSDGSDDNLLNAVVKSVAVVNGVSGTILTLDTTNGYDYVPAVAGASVGYENTALYVVGQNDNLGNFTGGNPANTMTVTVAYFVAAV